MFGILLFKWKIDGEVIYLSFASKKTHLSKHALFWMWQSSKTGWQKICKYENIAYCRSLNLLKCADKAAIALHSTTAFYHCTVAVTLLLHRHNLSLFFILLYITIWGWRKFVAPNLQCFVVIIFLVAFSRSFWVKA